MYELVALVIALTIYGIFLIFRILFYCQKNVVKNNANRNRPVSETPEPATFLTIPPTPQINHLDHGIIFPGALHIDSQPQISPPPYSAVALPPSYDEAIKQTTEETRATFANSSTEENKY